MENSPRPVEEDETKEPDYQRRAVALEANQLHGKKLPAEKIGHVLISGKSGESKQTTKEDIDWQRVSTMSRDELLEISSEVTVDSTTLRHVYDTHLIGENGLRRLVYEHMQGGDIQEVLHHEILEHEADFERDPRLRRQPQRPDDPKVSAESAADASSLNDLLGKAGLAKLDPGKELTSPKLLPEHGRRQGLQPGRRRLLDAGFIAIIIILLVLVAVLAMSRR
ncbi:MAG TPA: hypothetical protein VHA05_03690 [Candidatus Saccharimonadales bacterium]|nr:hypothetical protein [Candidatus Saccharimonadales bacterium]